MDAWFHQGGGVSVVVCYFYLIEFNMKPDAYSQRAQICKCYLQYFQIGISVENVGLQISQSNVLQRSENVKKYFSNRLSNQNFECQNSIESISVRLLK